MKFKNIIFDFGNTIIKFDPYYMYDAFFKEEKEKREEFVREIFSREYWDKLDEGTLSTDEYYNLLTKKIPHEYHQKLYNICFNWYKECPYIEGMVELIKKLKKDGYKIYLLSNILKEFSEYKDYYEVFDMFDGLILSGVEGVVKPSDEIFRLTLDKFGLKAEESLFVDDLKHNIDGAERNKINGYIFDGDAKKLEKFIYEEN